MDGAVLVSAVRRATLADVPHMVAVARKAYARFPVDWAAVDAWLRQGIEAPQLLALVSAGGASVAVAQPWFWRPGVPEAVILFIAGAPWDMVRCARATVAWARDMGAENVKIDADTGADLLPLVRRIGLVYDKSEGFTVRVQ